MGTLTSKAIVPAAFTRLTNAHRRLILTNSCLTFGRFRNVAGMGTKSWASFSARGRPRGTDSRNAPPTRAVASEGCKKYTNMLAPLASATMERAVRPTVARTRRPGSRSFHHRWRTSAR